MIEKDFLLYLKPGDEVIVSSSGHIRKDYIARIERLTKTQIVLDNGIRYRRKNGIMVGSDRWCSSSLVEYNEKRAEIIDRYRMIELIKFAATPERLGRLSTTRLSRILNQIV